MDEERRKQAAEGMRRIAGHLEAARERAEAMADAIEAGKTTDEIKKYAADFLRTMERFQSDLPGPSSTIDSMLEQ
jgi:hypothetical protein